MNILPCLSWVPFLWGQVCELFAQKRTVGKTLPNDLIVNVLSRLPAEQVILCGHACKSIRSLTKSPDFVNMHLSRASPVITFQYISDAGYYYPKICHISINLIDEEAKKIVTKRIRIDLSFASPGKYCVPVLYGSHNGFLLFRNALHNSVLFIWNPITQEQLIVTPQEPEYRLRGFFFHPTSGEYRVLFIAPGEACFKFVVYSLATKLSRQITSFSHPPTGSRRPAILNGALHWMVHDDTYKKEFGVLPSCSNSIVVYNMEREDFCTMSHPGGQCYLESKHVHIHMGLVEIEGCLCYCHVLRKEEVIIWYLQDYEKQVWVKRHVVSTNPMKKLCICRTSEIAGTVEVIDMYGDDLLLSLSRGDLFLYNLHSATFRRVGKKGLDSDSQLYPTIHINSLVPLCKDQRWHGYFMYMKTLLYSFAFR